LTVKFLVSATGVVKKTWHPYVCDRHTNSRTERAMLNASPMGIMEHNKASSVNTKANEHQTKSGKR